MEFITAIQRCARLPFVDYTYLARELSPPVERAFYTAEQVGEWCFYAAVRSASRAYHHYRQFLSSEWNATIAFAPFVVWQRTAVSVRSDSARYESGIVLRGFIDALLEAGIQFSQRVYAENYVPPPGWSIRFEKNLPRLNARFAPPPEYQAFADESFLIDSVRRLWAWSVNTPVVVGIVLGTLVLTLHAYATKQIPAYTTVLKWAFHHAAPVDALFIMMRDGVFPRVSRRQLLPEIERATRATIQQMGGDTDDSRTRLYRTMQSMMNDIKGATTEAYQHWRVYFHDWELFRPLIPESG